MAAAEQLTAEQLGLKSIGKITRNLDYPDLFEQELERKEGNLTTLGSMTVDTGKFTGRSPKDKYFVKQDPSNANIAWGNINQPISAEIFDELYADTVEYLAGKDLYVTDGYAGANPSTRKQVRFITEFAWQSHFVKNMFIRPGTEDLPGFSPDFTIYNASNYTNPKWEKMGLNSEVFIVFTSRRMSPSSAAPGTAVR